MQTDTPPLSTTPLDLDALRFAITVLRSRRAIGEPAPSCGDTAAQRLQDVLADLDALTPPDGPHDLRGAEDDDLDAFRAYVSIKATISRLTDQLDALKPRLLSLVLDQPADGGRAPVARAFGQAFTVQYRTTYDYSDQVRALVRELKALKKLEEAQGLATIKKQSALLVMKRAA